MLKFTKQQIVAVSKALLQSFRNICRENFRRLLLFLRIWETFAGNSTAFVVVSALADHICWNFPGVCCRFGRFGKHLPGEFPAFVVVLSLCGNICRGGGRWFSARGIMALLRCDAFEEEVRALAVRRVTYKIFRSVRRNAFKHRLVISNA